MTFKKSNKNNSDSGKAQNSQNSKKSNGSAKCNGRTKFNNKVSDFKFQLQDSGNKKAYTFEKIREAVILKIQTNF